MLELILSISATTAAAGVIFGYLLGRRTRRAAPPAVPPPPTRPAPNGEAFLAGLSHEWRTPLTAIIGYTEILQEDAAHNGQDQLLPDLRRVQSASQLLLGLVDDAVDLWRFQSGSLEIVPQRFDVARLVEEVIRDVSPLIETSPVELEVEVGDLPAIRSDRVKVKRSVTNLIRYVCGLSGSGTLKLTVSASDADDRAWIDFRLRHPMVDAKNPQVEYLVKELQRRGDHDPKRVIGTGMGVVVAVELCRLLGGSLRLAFGENGTTFVLRYPIDIQGTAPPTE